MGPPKEAFARPVEVGGGMGRVRKVSTEYLKAIQVRLYGFHGFRAVGATWLRD